MFYFHPAYFFVLAGAALVFWAQSQVKGTYRRYSAIPSSMGLTGAQVAQKILHAMGIHDVKVEPVAGELSDHYDPTTKTVRLSQGIYGSSSLAAAAVAAHECGHVLQDKKGYVPMNIRAALVPVANLGSQLGPTLVILGVILSAGSGISSIFVNLGIILFAAAILFHVVTLPVELDASGRALRLIDELGILQGEENKAARAVLRAAAFTYVATALYSALQLVYFFLISRRSN